MFSSSLNEYTNLDNAYPEVKGTLSRTMHTVHTNIQYPEIPPFVSGGMSVSASWQPESENNSDLLAKTGITTNWQYRKYLMNNAKDIIEYNYRESINDQNENIRKSESPHIQSNAVTGYNNAPRLQHNVSDMTHRFGKPTSDLKNRYLSREQMNALKISPVIDPRDLNRNN
jgi:hypothetical protein